MRFPDHGMGVYNGMPVKKNFDVKGKIKDKLKNLKREKYEFLASVDDPDDVDEEEIEYSQAQWTRIEKSNHKSLKSVFLEFGVKFEIKKKHNA